MLKETSETISSLLLSLAKKYIFELLFLILSVLLLSSVEVYFTTLLLSVLFSIVIIFEKFNLDYTWPFIFTFFMVIVLLIFKPFILILLLLLYIPLLAFSQLLFFAGPTVVLLLLSFILVRHLNIKFWKKIIFTFLISIVLGLNFKIPFVVDSLVREKSKPIINEQLIIDKKEFVNLFSNTEIIDYGFSPFPCMCDSYDFPIPYPSHFGQIIPYKEDVTKVLQDKHIFIADKEDSEISIHLNVENSGKFTKVSYMIKKRDKILSSYHEKFISKFIFDKGTYYRGNAIKFFDFSQRIRLVVANNIWMKVANHFFQKRYEDFSSFIKKSIKYNFPKKEIVNNELVKEIEERKIRDKNAKQKEENEKIKKIFEENKYDLNSLKLYR